MTDLADLDFRSRGEMTISGLVFMGGGELRDRDIELLERCGFEQDEGYPNIFWNTDKNLAHPKTQPIIGGCSRAGSSAGSSRSRPRGG